jgi:hypothetical protein
VTTETPRRRGLGNPANVLQPLTQIKRSYQIWYAGILFSQVGVLRKEKDRDCWSFSTFVRRERGQSRSAALRSKAVGEDSNAPMVFCKKEMCAGEAETAVLDYGQKLFTSL